METRNWLIWERISESMFLLDMVWIEAFGAVGFNGLSFKPGPDPSLDGGLAPVSGSERQQFMQSGPSRKSGGKMPRRQRDNKLRRVQISATIAVVGMILFSTPSMAQESCTVSTISSCDFEPGNLPPGWSMSGVCFLNQASLCTAGSCMSGTIAHFAQMGSCDCAIGSHGCQSGTLSSPPIAIPAVGSGGTIQLDFCMIVSWASGYLDATPPELEIESAFGNVKYPLLTVSLPIDLTQYAGEVIQLHWVYGGLDNEDHGGMFIDDIELLFYTGTGGDCNGNVIPDDCDITNGISQDCNANGVPDECDMSGGFDPDCNQNGIPDSCDIASGSVLDCDQDGVPDGCALASGLVLDCNVNGVPDSCDIANGLSTDFDFDGVPDECQCSYQKYCVTSPNSVGLGALISISGSTSKTLNDTMLLVDSAPPGQIGIFFYGANQVQIPFGDGWRCVATMVERLLPSVPIDPGGHGAYFLDLQGPPPAGTITPGATWNFQFWYRDPIPVGVGYNLSDAIEITFCP